MTLSTGGAEDIIINGEVFNRVDDDGNRWIITDLEGWWGLPEATVPDDPRPFQDDGSYFATGRYEARQITVSGHIVPGVDTSSVVRARNSLNRKMNLIRTTGILQVNETLNGGPKISAVQLVSQPLTRFNDIKNVLEFNFQLRAPDPRKYSADRFLADTTLESTSEGRTYDKTFDYVYGAAGEGGLMAVTNSGSYNTYGVITITGPVVQPAIEHIELGKTISFDISLGTGEFLVVNLKDKTVLLSGTESRRNTLNPGSEWIWFPSGDSTLRFSGYQVELGPAKAEVMIRSAWIE